MLSEAECTMKRREKRKLFMRRSSKVPGLGMGRSARHLGGHRELSFPSRVTSKPREASVLPADILGGQDLGNTWLYV